MSKLELSDEAIKTYLGFLFQLNSATKRRLIKKLSESITVTTKKSARLRDLSGAWEDERSTEEIVADIRSSRTSNRQIEGFQ